MPRHSRQHPFVRLSTFRTQPDPWCCRKHASRKEKQAFPSQQKGHARQNQEREGKRVDDARR